MYVLSIFICIALIAFFAITKHNTRYVYIVTLSWYLVITLASSLGIYGITKATEKSAFLVLFGTCLICITSFITENAIKKIQASRNPPQYKTFYEEKSNSGQTESFETVFSVCRWVFLPILTFLSLRLVLAVSSGIVTYDTVRTYFYTEDLYDNSIFRYIYLSPLVIDLINYVIRGFVIFDVMCQITRVIQTAQFEIGKVKIVPFVNFVLLIFCFQSRIELLRLCLFIVGLLLLSGNRFKFSNLPKNVKRIIPFVLLGLIAIIIGRKGEDSFSEGVLRNAITDFVGGTSAFGRVADNIKFNPSGFSFPILRNFFGGIEAFLHFMLEIILSIDIGCIIQDMNAITNPAFMLSSDIKFNAFYTMYFNFYFAGGYIGCIISETILGIILGNSILKYTQSKSEKNLVFAAFWFSTIAFGVINWSGANFYIWEIVILLLLKYQTALRMNAKGKYRNKT